MAINFQKEIERWLEARTEHLLDVVSQQSVKQVTPEKVELLQLARLYDPVYHLIERHGIADTFVSLLACPQVETQNMACNFLKGCCMYQQQFGDALKRRTLRLFEMVGDDKRGMEAKHAACSLLCHMARNEYFHEDILQNSLSLVDMLRSREWPSERAAATMTAYAFTNPILMEQAVGVTAKTDLLARINNSHKKSQDYITRRMCLKVLAASGRARSMMTNDDIISLHNTLRVAPSLLDASVFFTTTFSYAMVRHYLRWGFQGQLGAVVGASTIAALTSAALGVYTGEYLAYLVQEKKFAYLDSWGTEQRKDRLRRLNRQMSRLPGSAGTPLGEMVPERYQSLREITNEVFQLKVSTHANTLALLAFLSVPLPWYIVTNRFMSRYAQLRLGPRFHRLFPALSIKYTRRPRAVLPFLFLPTLAAKAVCDSPHLESYIPWNPLRLLTL